MNQLTELSERLRLCSRCELRAEATAPVPGIGSHKATYFIMGEAPGQNEDETGTPFVGLAGKRLNKLLALGGIDPNDCYFSNTCRCLPPKVSGKRRAPRKGERLACYPWLKEELKIIKPKVIIPLGAVPLTLFTEVGITQLHGTQFKAALTLDEEELEVEVWPMYHPAAALHQPRLWAVMLNDWEHHPDQVNHDFTVMPTTGKECFSCPVAWDTENDETGKLGVWSVAMRDTDEDKIRVYSYDGSIPIFNPSGTVIMHNAKWDLRVLARNGMKCPKPEQVFDSMVAAYCRGLGRQEPQEAGKPGDRMVGGIGLKYLARRHLGMEMKTWEQVKDAPEEEKRKYNADDSVATLLLYEKWKDDMPQHFWDIDMPLLDVCMKMEDRGIMIDADFLQKYADSLDERLAGISKELPINPHSPKQIQEYVYKELGYEPTKFTGTGQPSTDAAVLEQIDDPIIKRILEYREYSKERKTYLSNYQEGIDVENRLHCEFKQTRTATGRLASARPNLQNVTKDTDLRKMFVAPEGFVIVRMDWKLIEFGCLAALSKDPDLIAAFLSEDVHQVNADALGTDRDTGKHITFLIQNGGAPWAISQLYGIPIDQATEYYKKYYKRFPGLARFHDETLALAYETKKAYSYFGRENRIDALIATDWKTRKDGEKQAKTMPMQSTAAEIVKLAMIDLHYKHNAPMLINVHDELLFEIPKEDAEDYCQWLREYVPALTEVNGVQFPVNVSYGANWAEAKENER